MMYRLGLVLHTLLMIGILIFLGTFTGIHIAIIIIVSIILGTFLELVYIHVLGHINGWLYNKGIISLERAVKPAKRVMRSSSRLLGFKVKVVGKENIPKNGEYAIISNHQSLGDIPILIGNIKAPFAFIAKKELKKVPIVSSWMKTMRCVLLDRKNPRQGLKVIKQGAELIKQGQPMLIFPEGTRSKDGTLGEFKSGSFKIAYKSERAILPITLSNVYKMKERWPKITKVTMTIHKPIFYEEYKDLDSNQLAKKVSNIIANAL